MDANRRATAEGLPDYDTFADAAYNFCTVRSLDAWDLSMLKVLNDDMRVKSRRHAHGRASRRAALDEKRPRAEAQGGGGAPLGAHEARRCAFAVSSDVAPRHRAGVASMRHRSHRMARKKKDKEDEYLCVVVSAPRRRRRRLAPSSSPLLALRLGRRPVARGFLLSPGAPSNRLAPPGTLRAAAMRDKPATF